MKKLPFYAVALLAFPFVVFAQEPRDSSRVLHPAAVAQPQDSVPGPGLRFEAGSVRYPSANAFSLLQRVGKPAPCCYADKSTPLFPNHPFLFDREYGQHLAKRFALDNDGPRIGPQCLIALPFLLLDADGVMDENDWKRKTGTGW